MNTTCTSADQSVTAPCYNFSSEPAKRKESLWRRREVLTGLALVIWTLLLNLPGLGAIEFFRHTEADRTLISWEMLERRDFLIPHILDSEILTKPPIFYWTVALSIYLFGEPLEWVARLPCVIAASLLVLTQFIFVRSAGGSYLFALVAALALSSGILFLNLASSAEIDMMYGLFSTLTLCFLYFGLAHSRAIYLLLAYLFAGIAFLTKGPPIIAFFATALITFSAWRISCDRAEPKFYTFKKFIGLNILGVLLFLLISGSWLVLVARRVGWDVQIEQFRIEIFERFFFPSYRDRGFWYYFTKLPANLLPWAPLIIVGLLAPLYPGSKKTYADHRQNHALWRFCVFHGVVVIGSIFILSLAQGKSTRYMFPVYPFAMSITAVSLLFLKDSALTPFLYRVGYYFGSLLFIIGVLAAPIIAILGDPMLDTAMPRGWSESLRNIRLALQNLPLAPLFLVSWLGAIMAYILKISSRRCCAPVALLCLLLVSPIWRLSERTIYAPYRNSTRSVSDLAHAVTKMLPQKAPLHTVEMFERWVVYYIKRNGTPTSRVTPQLVSKLEAEADKRIYLLLSHNEEYWRLLQLKAADPSTAVIANLTEGHEHLLLVETNSHALKSLHVKKWIPTDPSLPYYNLMEPTA